MHKLFLFLSAILMLTIVSCDSNSVYDEYKSFPNGWAKDSLANFRITNIDTTHNYNMFINVRNNSEYKYSNLFLISEINFPNGKVITDTLEYQMAAHNGEWLGTGFGELKENKLWLKEQIRFVEQGDYLVTLQHAMRKNGEDEGIEVLEGITEVGIRIEHINTNTTPEN